MTPAAHKTPGRALQAETLNRASGKENRNLSTIKNTEIQGALRLSGIITRRRAGEREKKKKVIRAVQLLEATHKRTRFEQIDGLVLPKTTP